MDISHCKNIVKVSGKTAKAPNVHFRNLLGIQNLTWYLKSRSIDTHTVTIWCYLGQPSKMCREINFLGIKVASTYLIDDENAH